MGKEGEGRERRVEAEMGQEERVSGRNDKGDSLKEKEKAERESNRDRNTEAERKAERETDRNIRENHRK